MKKTRLLMCAALAACALASAAFASSPPVAESPPGFDRAQVAAVAKDMPAVSSPVAATGQGAQSALKAYEASRQSAPAPVHRASLSAGLGGFERIAAGQKPGTGPERQRGRTPQSERPLFRWLT